MAKSDAAWGIEIGSYAIKAIRIERDGPGVAVSDFAYIPHKKVLTTPDLDQSEMIRLGLGQLISQKSLENEHLVFSVPGHAAFARFAKLPPVEPKKVPDIVKFEAVQQIPFPIEEVEWDYQTFTSEDSPETEVGIFAITRDRVEERLGLYNELGLTPEALTLSPVAVYNAMSYDMNLAKRSEAIMFIDIGTQATDVIIAEEDRCWIRTFPRGGTHFTEAIANAFKLSYSKAEKLKQEAATSKYAKQIMQAMRPVFSDLLEDLQRSIGYYQNLHRDTTIKHVVGLGSTFKVPGLRKFLGQQLQLNVVRLDEYKKIQVTGREAASFAEHAVNFATAYGLAVQGVGLAPINANLVPVATLREQMWRGKTKWFAAAAVIVIAGSALTLVPPLLQGSAVAAGDGPREVTSTLQHGNRLKNELQAAQNSSPVGAMATNMTQLLDDRTIWPYIVYDVADALKAAEPQPELMSGDPLQVLSIDAENRRLVDLEQLTGQYVFSAGGEGGGDASGAPAPAGGSRRIVVTMEVELSHRDPINFLNQTVAQWLRANAERPDRPYRIIANSINLNPQAMAIFEVEDTGGLTQTASGSSGTGGGGGGTPGGTRTPGGPGFGSAGGSGFSGGGFGAGSGPGGGPGRNRNAPTTPVKPPGPAGAGASGAGSPSPGVGSGGPSRPSLPSLPDLPSGTPSGGSSSGNGEEGTLSAADLAAMAPIPERPQLFNPGDQVYRVPVTFEVEIIKPNAPAAPPAGASAARTNSDAEGTQETAS